MLLQLPALCFTICVTFSHSFNISLTQLWHLYNGYSNSFYMLGLLGGLNKMIKMIHIKQLEQCTKCSTAAGMPCMPPLGGRAVQATSSRTSSGEEVHNEGIVMSQPTAVRAAQVLPGLFLVGFPPTRASVRKANKAVPR